MKKLTILLIVILQALAFGYVSLSGNISDQTLTSGTYYITSEAYIIPGSTLIIDPGTVLKFEPGNTDLEIYGRLDVNGNSDNKVYFTSLNDNSVGETLPGSTGSPNPGDWEGIYINDTQSSGEFDYAIIRYAGAYTAAGDAALYYRSSSSGHFNNSICEYSKQRGIYSQSTGIDVNYSTFSNNGSYPVLIDNAVLKEYTGNILLSNGYNIFGINGTIQEDYTWPSSDSGFIIQITGEIYIPDSLLCTINPGTVIKSELNGYFQVDGVLDVNGTEAEPVIFTSFTDDNYGGDSNCDGSATSPNPGDWEGIYINDTQSSGEFDYAIIRYAGAYTAAGDAALYYRSSSSGHFNNSICEYSGQEGMNLINSPLSLFRSSIINNNGYGIIIGNGTITPDLGSLSKNSGMNTFVDNSSGGYQICNLYSRDINAYNNEWGFDSADSIDAHIYDNDEDITKGEVFFDPWFTERTEISLISDSLMNFGTVYSGLSNTLPLIIKNTGTLDLEITEVNLDQISGGGFSFIYDSLPLTMNPQESDTITVVFTPLSEQFFSDTIQIVNNSENMPILKVALSGEGIYDSIPAPENVSVSVNDGNATISWDPVTQTVHGAPVDIDFYVINYSEQVETDPESYYHLTATENLSFVHERVVQFSSKMFYEVIAIRDYEEIYKSILNKNNTVEKITWEDIKKNILWKN